MIADLDFSLIDRRKQILMDTLRGHYSRPELLILIIDRTPAKHKYPRTECTPGWGVIAVENETGGYELRWSSIHSFQPHQEDTGLEQEKRGLIVMKSRKISIERLDSVSDKSFEQVLLKLNKGIGLPYCDTYFQDKRPPLNPLKSMSVL